MFDNGLSGFGQITVAATLCRQVHNDGAGLHGLDHVFGDQDRALGAGNGSRGDYHVHFLDHFGHQLALALQEVLALGLGITAAALGFAGIQIQFHRLGANGEDLFAGSRAHVLGFHHGTQALGGGTGLQACHTGTHNEHAGRIHGTSSGHVHGEHALGLVGGK